MMKSLHMTVIAGVISGLSVTAMAAVTTSEYGEGGFTDGSSVGDILNNLLGTDGVQQVDLTDLSALATALINADSFDYSGNASLFRIMTARSANRNLSIFWLISRRSTTSTLHMQPNWRT